MDRLRQDLVFALRLLHKDRAFAATTILTLALCIGANTAIFTVVRSVLLRPLPYEESDRLVIAYDAFPGAGVERAGTSVPNYLDRVPLTQVFDSVALYRFNALRVGTGQNAEGVTSVEVTPSFFRVLRARAASGRLFTEGEGQIGRQHVALLSHDFAARLSGRIVGRELRLNDRPHTVVGVLPEDFRFLDPEVRIWTPLAFSDEQRAEDARYSQNHELIARLAPGVTLAQARARLDALTALNLQRAGALAPALRDAGYHTRLLPLQADVVRKVRTSLHLLWGGALFVLLIAGVNITNLALVRASGRLRELATRHALGAAQARVTRQLITETTLLTTIGGAVGLALGAWSVDALSSVGFAEVPRGHEIRIDAVVVASIFGMAAALGFIVGAVPAAQIAGPNLNAALRDEGRSGTAGRGTRAVRRGLVVAQVALAFVLLVGAGLLLASFQRLLKVDPGFTAEHVVTGRVTLLESRYPDMAAVRAYTSRALERIRGLPGVEAAGVTTFLPFSLDADSSVVIPEGYTPVPGESVVSPNVLRVSPGYFEAMRVPLKRGRFFTESDTDGTPRVVIVDERLARRFWGDADPVGRRMYRPQRPEEVARPGPDALWLQVIGVVGAVKLKGLIEGEDARLGAYYYPYAQDAQRGVALVIRTTGDSVAVSTTVRRVLAVLDPEVQLSDVLNMPDRVERSLTSRRTPMLLSVAFGLLALLLASIGIYGVLAYQVSQRTREIGIRMALGCDTRGVLGLVFREGVGLVLVGLAIGALGAVALRQFIASQLYGVGPLDPVVMLSVTGVLALTAGVACLSPARRAARVSPVVTLSQQ